MSDYVFYRALGGISVIAFLWIMEKFADRQDRKGPEPFNY